MNCCLQCWLRCSGHLYYEYRTNSHCSAIWQIPELWGVFVMQVLVRFMPDMLCLCQWTVYTFAFNIVCYRKHGILNSWKKFHILYFFCLQFSWSFQTTLLSLHFSNKPFITCSILCRLWKLLIDCVLLYMNHNINGICTTFRHSNFSSQMGAKIRCDYLDQTQK